MAECAALYKPNTANFNQLATSLKKSLSRQQKGMKITNSDGKNITYIQNFIDTKISRYRANSPMTIAPNMGNTESETITAYRALLADIKTIIDGWNVNNPGHTLDLQEIQSQITAALNISYNNQIEKGEQDLETKDTQEDLDQNTANLDDHLEEFYGRDARSLIQTLKTDFLDLVTSNAYRNIATNEVLEMTNEGLNQRIRSTKEQLFNLIIRYLNHHHADSTVVKNLKDTMYVNGILDINNYTNALNAFYALAVSNNSTFRVTVRDLNSQKLRTYGVEETKGFFQRCFDENIDIDLLTAANAYTSLRYFDSLLMEQVGDHIEIAENTEGLEVNITDKYSYKRETKHQKKGFQDENGDTEKHTSNQLKMLIGSMRVYHYKDGRYMHRRVTLSALLQAFNNLFSGIRKGYVTINGESDTVDAIKESILTFHDNPVLNLKEILTLVFGENGNNEILITTKIQGNTSIINEGDLHVLKTFYDVVFNEKSSFAGKSFFNQAIDSNVIGFNSANYLVEMLSGYIDRNTEVNYLQSFIDNKTNDTTVVVREKYFKDLKKLSLFRRINTHINYQSLAARQRLADLYNFKIEAKDGKENVIFVQGIKAGEVRTPIEVGKSRATYTVEVGEGDTALPITFTDYNGIGGFFYNFKSSAFDITIHSDQTILHELSQIDLEELERVYNNSGTLSLNQARLIEVLRFIDSALNLGIMTNPVTGLQTLNLYKQDFEIRSTEDYSYLVPLLNLAIKSMYINDVYIQANNGNLKEFGNNLTEQDKHYPLKQLLTQPSKNSNLMDSSNGNTKFRIANYKGGETFFDNWVTALSIMDNSIVSSIIKDASGNSISNYRVNNLGMNSLYYLHKQEGTNVGSLSFAGYNGSRAIREIYNDLDITIDDVTTKAVKRCSSIELYHHAIFNKFWSHYFQSGTVVIQPTAYSDKTAFYNYEINCARLDNDPFEYTKVLRTFDNENEIGKYIQSENAIINRYRETLGTTYARIADNYRAKLKKITDKWLEDNLQEEQVAITQEDDTVDHYETMYSWVNLAGLRTAPSLHKPTTNEILHQMTETEFVDLAHRLGLEVQKEADYKVIENEAGEKVVGINELIEYNERLYNTNPAYNTKLRQLLQRQRHFMLQQLLRSKSKFQVFQQNTNNPIMSEGQTIPKETDVTPLFDTIFKAMGGDKQNAGHWLEFCTGYRTNKKGEGIKDESKAWVDAKTGRLILAKQTVNGETINILKAKDYSADVDNLILNPLLEEFFLVEGYLTNNLRLSIPGSEVNHPYQKGAVFNKIKKAIRENIAYNTPLSSKGLAKFKNIMEGCLDIHDLYQAYKGLNPIDPVRTFIENIIDESLIYNINTAQQAQYKRNSIVPATLQYVLQNTKEGVAKEIKCAVIYDVEADVFNYRGESDKIDSCDGNAKIAAIQCILENRALQDQAVGFVKKPIYYNYDPKTGTSFLAKFATDTLTNEVLRRSLKSNNKLLNLHKKMLNLQWKSTDNIDLTQDMQSSETHIIDHDVWMKQTILGGKQLFYENAYGEIIEIIDFNKEYIGAIEGLEALEGTSIYYTVELYNGETQKVYHIFHNNEDNKSIHQTAYTIEEAASLMNQYQGHTINSLYELHTALGGIYCCDANGVVNDYNNEVVCNFMCNIGKKRSQSEEVPNTQYVNQTTYHQILKDYYIGYAFNKTAVKNGARNINAADRWYNNEDLSYFILSTEGLGIQLNADHDIVNSELTEFSQVIAACAAYGYTFDNCNEIFQSLARASFQSSESVLKATDRFLQTLSEGNRQKALSDLYDSIGRIILMNSQIKDDEETLTNIIFEAVQKVFNAHADHTNDTVLLPFSSPQVYSQVIATLASTITKNSIKRKHPGSGCVMVPGFDMVQYFEIYNSNGQLEKVFTEDVLNRARNEYRTDLLEFLSKQNPDTNYNTYSLTKLISEALAVDPEGKFSAYYTSLTDNVSATEHLLSTFLEKAKRFIPETQIFYDRSYFVPSDIVEVITETGEHVEDVDLNSLEAYYKFKEGKASWTNCKYRISTTSPHNLRPSLIRWQYKDNEGTTRYMNYFDLPHIREIATAKPEERKALMGTTFRKRVQDSLHDIHEGQFTLREADGQEHIYQIIEGSLENMEAELVMSNIYKELFGIENESLNEVLKQGESYFNNRMAEMQAPIGTIHDMTFIKDDGKHVLITIGDVHTSPQVIKQSMTNNVVTNEKGELVLVQNGKELFEIGKWVDADPSIVYDEVTNTFSQNGKTLNPQYYRRTYSGVQKRIDYVTKYQVVSSARDTEDDKFGSTNILYKIADVKTLQKALNTTSREDAVRQQASIINKIFISGNYKLAQLNTLKLYPDPTDTSKGLEKRKAIAESLLFMRSNRNINNDIKLVLEAQINNIENNVEAMEHAIAEAKENYINKEAHKQYISFLDSLKVISSRIPAQTLQSFMPMKVIGWTQNSKNMCYVSHFQTYLQGSDYDIDKAYIMGQSYDGNAIYAGWSPFFDYTSLSTLEASKALPIPKRVNPEFNNQGIDISEEVSIMMRNAGITEDGLLTTEGRTVAEKNRFLRAFGKAIQKLEYANGLYYFKGNIAKRADKIEALVNTFKAHEFYTIPAVLAEKTYKNAAAANIFAVAHDVRNRDQAYTQIAMDIMREGAEASPKGEQVIHLNSLNSLAKYEIQYQNMVGKNVIGVSANGEKFWFNAYYYWTKVLKYGTAIDRKYLKFCTTLTRIEGRAKGTKFDPAIAKKTTTHLPDLDIRDNKIRSLLINEFQATDTSMEYSYVDQKISQMLSAATDNAKELILAKINAGNNFAKMFLYLMMMDYEVNDIVAFMTTPISEVIDHNANANIFSESDATIKAYHAVDQALGLIASNRFIWGSYLMIDPTDPMNSRYNTWESLACKRLTTYINTHPQIKAAIINRPENITTRQLPTNLDVLMQTFIQEAIKSGDLTIDINSILKAKDSSSYNQGVTNYARHCQDTLEDLQNAVTEYSNNNNLSREQAVEWLLADAVEFKKIYQLSSEMSDITTGLLGLNQGIATSEADQIKCLNNIKNIIAGRERDLGIKADELFNLKLKGQEIKGKSPEEVNALTSFKMLQNMERIIAVLKENNSTLNEDTIINTLRMAYENGIMNNFDPITMLIDPTYRQQVKDYLHILKGTINAIDMLYQIPHYREILECLKASIIGGNALIYKSRLVSELTLKNNKVSEKDVRAAIDLVDKANVINFISQLSPIITDGDIEGFTENFDVTLLSILELDNPAGIASFKHFVENEFLYWLWKNPKTKNNPFLKHLFKSANTDGVPILITDIDLLHPESSTTSRLAYDEIINGITEFAKIDYDTEYTVADIFQLYNLIINADHYGSERLTTIFKSYASQNSIQRQFYDFLSRQDVNISNAVENLTEDFLINTAPIVGKATTKRGTYVKEWSEDWRFTVKKYNNESRDYVDVPLLEQFRGVDLNTAEGRRRYINFKENLPFIMPNKFQNTIIARYGSKLSDAEITPDLITDLLLSGRLLVFKDC